MSLAETAVLAVELKLAGATAFSSGLKGAEASAVGLNTAVSRSGSHLGTLVGAAGAAEKGVLRLGGAFGHAKGQLVGLLTGPLGIIGLTGGLFSLGGIFESSIRHASDLGFAVEKLTGLTGDSAATMSQLLVTFEKYGLSADQTAQSVGFTEKTLGKLADTSAKAGSNLNKLQALQAKFGIALTDSAGRALPYATVLGNIGDFYNSSASASDKAYVASLLLGRGYAQLIPLLKLGSKGLSDAEQAAADLGLTLNDQNAKELAQYRSSIRDVGEAIGGLQLQIGLALIPEVVKLADGLTSFLSHGGTQEITKFFKDAAKFADDFGNVITTSVLPVFSGIADAWGKVPSDLKKLLVTGFVVNKASSFLFGQGLVSGVAGGLKGVIEGILGRVPGVSNVVGAVDPGQRVFVTNWPLGLGIPGIAGGAGAAAEVVGGLTAAAVAAGVATAVIAALPLVVGAAVIAYTASQREAPGAVDTSGLNLRQRNSPVVLQRVGELQAEGASQLRNAAHGFSDTATNLSESASQLRNASHGLQDAANASLRLTAAQAEAIRHADQVARGVDPNAHFTRSNITPRLRFLAGNAPGAKDTAVAAALVLGFETGKGGSAFRDTGDLKRTIQSLQADEKTLHGGDRTAIARDIDRLKTELARRNEAATKAAADKTAQSQALAGQKVATAIRNKDLVANVTTSIRNATYLNGRLLDANLQRYRSIVGSGISGGRDLNT